jgi:amino acid permease
MLEKNIIERKVCVLIFSIIFVWIVSHSEKNEDRYNKKCILVFM